MSRAVRRVPIGWQHPMEWREQWDRGDHRYRQQLVPRPLMPVRWYADAVRDWESHSSGYDDEYDPRPNPADYMPDFPDDPDTLGWCMYEEVSEGTPISPVFASPEELARWLADTGASAFGDSTATYEQWLHTCRDGWAPSLVATATGLQSGVEWAASHPRPVPE